MIVAFAINASLSNYQVAAVCYVINFALDEVDGNSARFLGQSEFTSQCVFLPPANNVLGGNTGITLSVCPSVCPYVL